MNRKNVTWLILFLMLMLVRTDPVDAEEVNGIDPEALIERILAVDQKQKNEIKDVVFDAEFLEGETGDDGEFVEKIRILKRVYLKYYPDTVLIHEEYLSFFEKGKEKSEEDRDNEASKRLEKKKKRKAKDISYPMLSPFYPENSSDYIITYKGVAKDEIGGRVCHQFRVDPRKEDRAHLEGDYYFEAETFHLVRVDFSPAKLVKKMMFKLHSLEMSILYGPTEDGYWLPRQFDVAGRGKAAFFFGVKFAGSEYYRNPIVNGGVSDSIFEEEDGK